MRSISDNDKKNIQAIVRSWLNRTGHEVKSGCPKPESIAGYAFGDLDPDNEKLIESHVVNCPKCLSEVVDLREIKASTDIPTLNIPNIINLLDQCKKARQEVAYWFVEKLRGIFPGYTEIELDYVGVRGTEFREPEIIRLPRQIWYATKKRSDLFTIIDLPNNELSTELKPLSEALQRIPFYFFVMGLGKDNKLKMISDNINLSKVRNLPIEVYASDVKDIDILWIVIDSDKDTTQNIYSQLKNVLGKTNISIPTIEPFAWLIVYVSYN
jgi:hypothetical protein